MNKGKRSRWRIYLRQKGICIYCQCRMHFESKTKSRWRRATLDHLIPRSRGGTNTAGNSVVCCAECNQTKGSMLPLEFIVLRISGRPINGCQYLSTFQKKLLSPEK